MVAAPGVAGVAFVETRAFAVYRGLNAMPKHCKRLKKIKGL
jgi:hypothetical protein